MNLVQRRKSDHARGRLLRVSCGMKRCAPCLEEYRRRKLTHFAEQVSKVGTLYRTKATAEEWKALRKRLSGKADYLRVPVVGGFEVLTTYQCGQRVADKIYAVSRAFDRMAVHCGSVTSSRAWAEVKKEERPASDWETVNVTTLPLDEVAEVFRGRGLRTGTVETFGRRQWCEVALPEPDDVRGWAHLRHAADLHPPWRNRPSDATMLRRLEAEYGPLEDAA